MLVYQHPTEDRIFYAPDAEPSIDAPVQISAIEGLNNYVLPRPQSHVGASQGGSSGGSPLAGSGPSGSYWGWDFRNAYLPGITNEFTGAGQNVGLVASWSGFNLSDIIDYESQAGLPVNTNISRVKLDNYDGSLGIKPVEVAIDIEMVISMAPGIANVVVYEGLLLNSILAAMAYPPPGQPFCSQLSCSFITGGTSSDPLLLELAAQGQSFFMGSGDSDAVPPASAQYPEDNPYVTSVGGTFLTNGASGAYVSETVWNLGGGSGSGGGVSTQYSIPSWQAGVSMSSNLGSTAMRNFPDVAMVASGVAIIEGSNILYQAGTSIAAPLWAGFTALVNQQAAADGYPAAGFLNAALYAVGEGANYGQCFHDITIGDNWPGITGTYYPAVAGYDLCTGWGSPNGTNLIHKLIEVSSGALGRGSLSSSGNSFSFYINAGLDTGINPYMYYSDYLPNAVTDWTQGPAVGLFFYGNSGPQQWTDSTLNSTVSNRFYSFNWSTNCWRPTGFITTQVGAHSMALLANQLDAPANTLDGLFNPMPNTTYPYLPNGAQIYIQTNSGPWTFNTYTWNTSGSSGYWTMGGTNVTGRATLAPGAGFWLTNPSPNAISVTFAGLVRQGTMNNPIPTTNTWSYSSMVPQAGGLQTNLGYSPHTNDAVYIWEPATTNYSVFTYAQVHGTNTFAWSPNEPSLQVGHAFVFAPGATNTWSRTLSTCP